MKVVSKILILSTCVLSLQAIENTASLNDPIISEVYQQLEDSLPKAFYAPSRASIFTSDGKPKERPACPFCAEIHENQDENFLILCRTKHAIAQLNPFPYAKGHILIIPCEHQGDLTQLSLEARNDIMALTAVAIKSIQDCYGTKSFNVGLNQGPDSGASLPDHLHTHIVPRTFKASFIHIIGNTGVAQCNLKDEYDKLKPFFDKQNNSQSSTN